jgi:hypothetical protein
MPLQLLRPLRAGLLVLGFPSDPPAPRVCVCSQPSPHLPCEMAVRAAALAHARTAELLDASVPTCTDQPPARGAAKNKRGLHCLRQETAGLPALPRQQHPVPRPRALGTSPACSLEQAWVVPNVTGSFRASAGDFFKGSSRPPRAFALAPSLFVFFSKIRKTSIYHNHRGERPTRTLQQ